MDARTICTFLHIYLSLKQTSLVIDVYRKEQLVIHTIVGFLPVVYILFKTLIILPIVLEKN